MADEISAMRQRREKPGDPLDDTTPLTKTTTKVETTIPTKGKTGNQLAKEEDARGISFLDVIRSLVFIVVASCGLSYMVTKESFVWGVKRPSWTKPDVIQAWMNGPLQLTDAQLRDYDGTDPNKPVYLAINGTIYDVTPGRRHYGPGGSYHFFAGADGSRAFVTQCFDVDIKPDMRGVEEGFLPLDDPEIDGKLEAKIGKGGMKKLREQERRNAWKQVDAALGHWVSFFESSGKYAKVGKVKREKGWETKGPKPPMCKKVKDGRKPRALPADI